MFTKKIWAMALFTCTLAVQTDDKALLDNMTLQEENDGFLKMSPVESPLTLISGRNHPIVQASNQAVIMDTPDKTTYQGTMYTGSKQIKSEMIYDTMSQFTAIITQECTGSASNSFYVPDNSESHTVYEDAQKNILRKTLDFGSVVFQGTVGYDNVCLINPAKNPTFHTGSLCVNTHKFIAVDQIIGGDEFMQGGVLGLAPDTSSESFVENLYKQGAIENMYVGLNFEYPEDKDQNSQITFGWFDYSQAKGGEKGLLWYENVGIDAWALMIGDLSYGSIDLQDAGSSAKQALVDSANTTIQIPQSQYDKMHEQMTLQDPTLKVEEIDGQNILVSDKPCKQIQKNLRDFKFKIKKTTITLRPAGYVWQFDNGKKSRCFIGISPIPDKFNHYRFGTIFLRNFYLALDYDANMIGFAQNVDMWDNTTDFDGTSDREDKKKKSNSAAVIVLVILFCFILVFGVVIYKRKQATKPRTLVSGSMNEQPTTKRYKDGVEVRPGSQEAADIDVPLNDDGNDEDDGDDRMIE